MMPQETDVLEGRAREHISTADLAQSVSRPVAAPAATRPQTGETESNAPLFAPNDTQDFRSRWEKIQMGFVDEPRKAVEQADELVASAIKRLAEVFCRRAPKAGSGMGKERQRLYGRTASRPAPVSVLLRPALVCLAEVEI